MKFFEFATLGDPNDESICFTATLPRQIDEWSYCLHKGKPLKEHYPDHGKIFLQKKYPGTKLTSHIGNTCSMILASEQMAGAIKKHCEGLDIEYLPVSIIDHRKKTLSNTYFIVNPLIKLDCVHEAKSRITYNTSGKVSFIDELVLDEKKMKNAPQLFRVDKHPSTYVCGDELTREFAILKLTNVLVRQLPVE